MPGTVMCTVWNQTILSRICGIASENGIFDMSPDEINAEIDAVRKQVTE